MTDLTLTTVTALGLAASLVAVVLDHAERDDDVRAAYTDCRVELATERIVADVCMAVVEDCRDLIEDHACACWRPK